MKLTLTDSTSRVNTYFPLLLKHASDIDVTISVKKFFLFESSYSYIYIAVLSQTPVYFFFLFFDCFCINSYLFFF